MPKALRSFRSASGWKPSPGWAAAVLSGFRPVIGPAPGQPGLWLAYGHAHWGLTLGPVTGRLVADMVTGDDAVFDPAPYAAERFLS